MEEEQEKIAVDTLDKEDSDYIKKEAIWTNILLSAIFASFMYQYGSSYSETPKISTFLAMVQVFCLIIFFLIRMYPQKTSYAPRDWIVALVGTWGPLLILPVEGASEIAFFLILQLIGVIISIIGILSLNRSLSIVPALRDIKTSGLYMFVRHPIYLGYFLAFSSLVAQNLTLFNVCVILVVLGADIMRIKAEERLLSESPTYMLYKDRVRWRLFPFIW